MSHYEKYKNMLLMLTAPHYRGLETEHKEFDKDQLDRHLHREGCIIVECTYPKTHRLEHKRGLKLYAVLCHANSDFHNKSANVGKLFSSLPHEKIEVLLFTGQHLKSQVISKIAEYSKTIDTYGILHTRIAVEIPKCAHCSPHTVVGPEEKAMLIDQLKIDIKKFPLILTSDPQIIWIGATIGELVKITGFSPVAGESVTYRIVAKGYRYGQHRVGDANNKKSSDDS
jgi:DNA-directed RNA polymerase subunit H